MARDDIASRTGFVPRLTIAESVERVSTFLRAAYGWMCAGLAITAMTASFVAGRPALVAATRHGRASPACGLSASVRAAKPQRADTYFSRRMCGIARPLSLSIVKAWSTMFGLPHR